MEKRERKGKREEKMRERVCVRVSVCGAIEMFFSRKVKETHIYRARDTHTETHTYRQRHTYIETATHLYRDRERERYLNRDRDTMF